MTSHSPLAPTKHGSPLLHWTHTDTKKRKHSILLLIVGQRNATTHSSPTICLILLWCDHCRGGQVCHLRVWLHPLWWLLKCSSGTFVTMSTILHPLWSIQIGAFHRGCGNTSCARSATERKDTTCCSKPDDPTSVLLSSTASSDNGLHIKSGVSLYSQMKQVQNDWKVTSRSMMLNICLSYITLPSNSSSRYKQSKRDYSNLNPSKIASQTIFKKAHLKVYRSTQYNRSGSISEQ